MNLLPKMMMSAQKNENDNSGYSSDDNEKVLETGRNLLDNSLLPDRPDRDDQANVDDSKFKIIITNVV